MADSREITTYEEPPAVVALRGALARQRGRFDNLLPSIMAPEELFSVAIAAVQKTPKLLECSQESIVNALLHAARLGLRPDGLLSEGWLVPRYNRNTRQMEAQFQAGYRGLEMLMLRAGARKIESRLVYDGEHFEVTYGLHPNIEHVPRWDIDRSDEAVVAGYAWMKNARGEIVFEVMTREELDAIRDRFAARTKEGTLTGPWITDTGEMRRKTLLRRLAKHSELSTEEKELVGLDLESEREYVAEPIARPALPDAKRKRGSKRLREKLAIETKEEKPPAEPPAEEKKADAEESKSEPPAEEHPEAQADGSREADGPEAAAAEPTDEAVEGEYVEAASGAKVDGGTGEVIEPASEEMSEEELLAAIVDATGGELVDEPAADEPAPEPEGEVSPGIYIGRVAFPAAGEKHDGKLKTYPDGLKRTYFGLKWAGGELLVVAVSDVAISLFKGPRFTLAEGQRVKIAGKKHTPTSGAFKGRELLTASAIETAEPGR